MHLPQTYSRNYETGFKCSCASAYRSSLHGTYSTAGNAFTLWHKVVSVSVTGGTLLILTERYTVGDITGLIDDVNTLKWLCSVLYRLSAVNIHKYFFVAQHPESVLGHLNVEVYRLHTHTLGGTAVNVWSVRRRSSYLDKHKGRNSMHSAGLKPALSAIRRLQAYVLDRTATRIG